jgi:hypothetical protein
MGEDFGDFLGDARSGVELRMFSLTTSLSAGTIAD